MVLPSGERMESEEPVGDAVTERPLAPRPAPSFLPARGRGQLESVLVRVTATAGVVGICVAIAAILGTQNVAAWIIGLVVSLASVILAGILWSSREL
jgi:hypothetical protein